MVMALEDAATYMEIVNYSNEATDLVEANQLQEAETLLRDVLLRMSGAGFDDVSIALTQNELGSVLRRLGALDEALELLTAALVIRTRSDQAESICIALRDGNITREEMAKVYEAKGDCASARKIRGPGRRICANGMCEAYDYEDSQLHACSRCKCVFYCGKMCQRQDWKSRHKTLCQVMEQVS
ncbi:hypothetical protein PsorP6_018765 [Peronosclerospora sorghi]|nr:hypothetical protein PsorP6_018765 [Peronosclerospora sorghi]